MPTVRPLLDCLEFDDRLRYVDVIDDAAFLAMDRSSSAAPDLARAFLRRYVELSGDDAPESLRHFYIAYRAVVRAKVEVCALHQGHRVRRGCAAAPRHRSGSPARRHGAPDHGRRRSRHRQDHRCPRAGNELGAVVISTDDVRAAMARRGEISGEPGVLGEGLYTRTTSRLSPRGARPGRSGTRRWRSVVLDGTWSDPLHRDRAREVAGEAAAAMVEFVCVAALDATVERIRTRTHTTSQVTPEIATALAARPHDEWPQAHRLDTSRPPGAAGAEALTICQTTS